MLYSLLTFSSLLYLLFSALLLGVFDLKTIQSHMVALLLDWERGNSSIKALPPPKKVERPIETQAFTSLKVWKGPIKLLTPVTSDVNYQEDVNGYFNTSFASKLQSSIVFEIIQILSDTFGVSQVILSLSLSLFPCPFVSFSLFLFSLSSLLSLLLSLSLNSSNSPVRPTGRLSKSIVCIKSC
jgi:hypothetical protein